MVMLQRLDCTMMNYCALLICPTASPEYDALLLTW
jgi:hypothetical protein